MAKFYGLQPEIEAGESIAIIGPSGQGKTTLAKLLLGLLKPENGSICINGIDHRKLGMTLYRDLIGSVMQTDQLFAGSIIDNISFLMPASTGRGLNAWPESRRFTMT